MNENGLRSHLTPATSVLLAICLTLNATPAHAATTCTASMTDVQFGSVDPFDGNVDIQATISYSCTITSLLSSSKVRMCFSIGSGLQGDSNMAPRQMLSGANVLYFQLYKDSGRNQIWGTRSDAYGSTNADMQLGALIGSTTDSGELTVYGRVPAAQTTLVPGVYINSFSGAHTELAYQYNEFLLGLLPFPDSCVSGGTGGGTGTFPFTASATVNAACNPTFSVQNIDFGTQGLLTAAIETTATLSPQCTNTTPYQVGLNNGLHASGNTRRMQSSGGQYVTYELYRDAGRSQRWGNTQSVDTLGGTGAGDAQNVTIYSRVASQNTPPSGDYSDTVTVTIYY